MACGERCLVGVGNGSGRCEKVQKRRRFLSSHGLYILNDKATLAAPPLGGLGCGVERISNSGWRVACGRWRVAGGGRRMVAKIMTSVDIIV
jgi:hypothetical protein